MSSVGRSARGRVCFREVPRAAYLGLALGGLVFGTACGEARPGAVCPGAAPLSQHALPIGYQDTGGSIPPVESADEPRAADPTNLQTREGGIEPSASNPQVCPTGMRLVDIDYCPTIERTCVDSEYSAANRITICHRYAEQQRCMGRRQRLRFCIDEYEYPNRKGAHPVWMVSWYDAQATCASLGKRLCLESEWVAACEGPREMPFPYGFERDHKKCNIDNTWIEPDLHDVYAKDPYVQMQELSRLDQSVPSGALPACTSGFGVHDMTGNFDEWVTADERHDDTSEWAGLKGGAWGHVRNACRPVTTSHPPGFTYYFISFRCCRDPDDEPEAYRDYPPASDPPPVQPVDRARVPESIYPPGPSRIKVGRVGPPAEVASGPSARALVSPKSGRGATRSASSRSAGAAADRGP